MKIWDIFTAQKQWRIDDCIQNPLQSSRCMKFRLEWRCGRQTIKPLDFTACFSTVLSNQLGLHKREKRYLIYWGRRSRIVCSSTRSLTSATLLEKSVYSTKKQTRLLNTIKLYMCNNPVLHQKWKHMQSNFHYISQKMEGCCGKSSISTQM